MSAAAVPKEFRRLPVGCWTLASQTWRELRRGAATHAAVTTLLSATPEHIMLNVWLPACAQKASFQRPLGSAGPDAVLGLLEGGLLAQTADPSAFLI